MLFPFVKRCNYPLLKPYDSEIVLAAIEKPLSITLQSAYWEERNGFECKEPSVKNVVLNPGDKAERGFMVMIQPDFVPPYASETVVNTLHINGTRADGEPVSCKMGYSVEVINKDYNPSNPDNPGNPNNDYKKLVEKANEELNKITSAIALDPNVMNDVFGIHGAALTQLEKEILTAVILSDAPEKSFEDKISEEVVKKVFKKFKVKTPAVGIDDYRVPLVYEIVTPKYGLVTVRFDCDVSMYKVNDKRFSFLVNVNYTIVEQMKDAKPIPDQMGYLGAGVSADVSAFAKSAYAVAEAELQNSFNDVWGNDAEKVANLFFNKTIKTILKANKTSAKKIAWKLMTWPSKKILDACPTDVFIYDENGVLCGAIENGVVTKSSEDFKLSVDRDIKYIEGLEDNYTVQYKATDDGTMSVFVTEYLGYQMPLRQVIHYDIPLKKGEIFTQSIAGEVHQSAKDYAITGGDGSSIPVDEEQTLITLEPNESTASGDLNGDGKVTMADVLRLARGAAGYVTLTEQEQKAGDVTGDGKITMADVIRVARFAAGYSPTV